jgi:hypothetical protein
VKTFLHGGDFGDLIYALPAIRALGGGALYLSEAHPGREPLTAARRDVLLPLLERIDYLADVRVQHGEPVDVDFTGFGKHLPPGEVNLAEAQLAGCGLPLDLADEAWIDRTVFRATGSVLRGGDSSVRALSKSTLPVENGRRKVWSTGLFRWSHPRVSGFRLPNPHPATGSRHR